MDDYSAKGFRLIAVAAGIVPDMDKLDLPNMSQQAIEAAAVGMVLLGLVVLANSIRDDSVTTIKALQEGYVLLSFMLSLVLGVFET